MSHNLTQKVIGVCFGGQNPEHDVSIITGLLAMESLKKLGMTVVPLYISLDGAWCTGEEFSDKSFLESIHTQDLYPFQGWSIDTRHRTSKLILTRRPHFFARREKITIDILVPAFHGAYGEDGTLQGLCEMLGVPYTGCGVTACAIASDKTLTKRLYKSLDIPDTAFVSFSGSEWSKRKDTIIAEVQQTLTLPIFVKPPHAGSSIGITRVTDWSDLADAIDTALTFDTDCLIEQGVSNLVDLTCSVREDDQGEIQASLVQASNFGGSDFFDFQEKYLADGGAQIGNADKKLDIPASIPPATTAVIREASVQIFKAIDGSGIARVDWLYDSVSDSLYASEINPLPGTFYHHLWSATGIETDTLFRDLLQAAVRKHVSSQTKKRYFGSEILGNVRSVKLGKKGA